jgi:hypothetical protein
MAWVQRAKASVDAQPNKSDYLSQRSHAYFISLASGVSQHEPHP